MFDFCRILYCPFLLEMAEKCFTHAMDLSGLVPPCFSLGHTEGVLKLATLATQQGTLITR